MSIWGKLAAATVDLSSPIGVFFGGGQARDARDHYKEQDGPENQLPFTVGVIALGAKMAKADGSVTTDEVKAFKEAFNVSAAEMKQAARVFHPTRNSPIRKGLPSWRNTTLRSPASPRAGLLLIR